MKVIIKYMGISQYLIYDCYHISYDLKKEYVLLSTKYSCIVHIDLSRIERFYIK